MDRTTSVPWYDDELEEMRLRQRRWLYGLRNRLRPPENAETFDTEGFDAIAIERRWRAEVDELVSGEWREALDALTDAAISRRTADLHDESAHGDRVSHSPFWNDLRHSLVKARAREFHVEIPPEALQGYADLQSALEVAERLATAADDAALGSRP